MFQSQQFDYGHGYQQFDYNHGGQYYNQVSATSYINYHKVGMVEHVVLVINFLYLLPALF